ncbi:MAG: cell division FtsZ family protein, partial [Paramuribaculum sp.]|nr:cell division FtsZ family protein [Paramuribaculum sp.]
TFVAVNTDEPALNKLPQLNAKVIIGDGHGAGNDPEVARQAAEDDAEKITAVFGPRTRMVFVAAGLGGGTGTGAAPVVARLARERGYLTIGIVTIPFAFEGKRKIVKALEWADTLAQHVDALLMINNERLVEIYPDLDFFNAFGKADDILTMAARSISEIITIDGFMNLDFNDVDKTLRDGRTAIISTGYGEGEGRVTKAIEDALNSPLLRNKNILGSKKLLINLYMSRPETPAKSEGNSGAMSMSEINELRNFTSTIDSDVDVITGVTVDNSLGDKVKITILAAGFEMSVSGEDEPEPEVVPEPTVIEPQKNKSEEKPKEKNREKEIERKLIEQYGPDMHQFGTDYIILNPDQLDDEAVIDAMERYPTFNRDKNIAKNIKQGITQTPKEQDDIRPGTELRFT